MIDRDAIWHAHQRARFMRPDAARFMRPDAARYIRPDVARFLTPGTDPADVYLALKYSPAQRRIPAGRPGGGRWTDEQQGGGGGGGSLQDVSGDGGGQGADEAQGDEGVDGLGDRGEEFLSPEVMVEPASDRQSDPTSSRSHNETINDPRVISDADPEPVKPGEQYAQSTGRRGGGSIYGNGQWLEPTPAQSARLVAAQLRADDALARVRELDPKWSPSPSIENGVEGRINRLVGEAEQAQGRINEIINLIRPGPFAGRSIPAPEGRGISAEERRQLNKIMSETGCHSCGTLIPGTSSGNAISDHKPPTALNRFSLPQRLYPQCRTCSLTQGGYVKGIK
ncbi:MAG: hypothetical protein H7312_18690 [Tardiphaga sp.]|nr:hypothetical protein [Tardiphaga sp.]